MRIVIFVTAMLALIALPAAAQIPDEFEPGSSVLKREELQRLLAQYEEALNSPAYSGRAKDAIRPAAVRVRARLEEGDFKIGDRVELTVEGEAGLPPDVPVEFGPKISLPMFGDISLKGVLRSEITDYLTTEISRFLKDPVIRARGLMRLSIAGAVGNAGFFTVSTDLLISEVIMLAGGPRAAEVEKVRIERAGKMIIGEREVQQAIVQGRTLDQLNLQAGDQIYVPAAKAGSNAFVTALGRAAMIIIPTVLFGIRIF